MLATGLYTENFSSDADDEAYRLLPEPDRPAFVKQPGFDSWDADPATVFPDALHIRNDLIRQQVPPGLPDPGFRGTTPTGGVWAVDAIDPDPLAPHVLSMMASGGSPTATFSTPSAGQPGGPDLGEGVTVAALSVFGIAQLQFVGDNGTLAVSVFNTAWERIVVSSDHDLPAGVELGAIRAVAVSTFEFVRLRDLTFQVDTLAVIPPPEARDDLIIVNRRTGASAAFNPLDNDFFPNFEGSFVGFTAPARGTLHRVGADFIYEASAAFLADVALTEDSFTYTIANLEGVTDTATVTLRLNRPPDGVRDVYALPHGQTTPLVASAANGVLQNDSDRDDTTLTVRLWTPPSHGAIVLDSDGAFTYVTTDPSGEIRSDLFTYALLDGVSEPVSVEVVLQVPNAAPVTSDGQWFLLHGTPGPIVENFGHSDGDGDPVRSVTLVQRPLHGEVTLRVVNGTAQFEYAPYSGDLRGSDEFTYRTSDGFAESNVARIELIVPNSPPVVENFNPIDDRRVADRLRVYENRAVLGPNGSGSVVWTMDDHIFDLDGDSPTVAFGPLYDDLGNLIGAPQHGAVAPGPLPGTFAYIPNPGFHVFGSDTFAYRVSDGYELSDIGWITVFQSLPAGHARSDSFTTTTDEPLEIGPGVLFGNDYFQGYEPGAPAMPAGLRGPQGNHLFVDGGEVRVINGGDWQAGRVGWLVSDYGGESYLSPTNRLNDDGSILYVPQYRSPHPFTGIAEFEYAFRYLSPGFETITPYSVSKRTSVLILVTETPQGDADGVDDNIERFVPYAHGDVNGDGVDDAIQFIGDGNGDGILDYQQANVAAVPIGGADRPSPLSSADWVVIESSGGATLFDVKSTRTLPSPGDEGHLSGAFPLGMFSFKVVGLYDGDATTVTIRPRVQRQFETYYKYGLEPEDVDGTPLVENETPHWYQFMYDGSTGAELLDDDGDSFVDRIVLHFIDGQRGDDDLRANGIIVDPGGPVTFDPIAPADAPRVVGTMVQDGMQQRSFVDRLSIDFSEQVNLAELIADGSIASVATLTNLGVRANADPDVEIPLSADQFRYEFDPAAGLSRLTWSLDAFAGTGASLPDGVYRLTLDADAVRDLAGHALDGDGDDQAGGDFRAFFHRLGGDANGDLLVDKYDMKLVNAALSAAPGSAAWNANADLDRDLSITVRDRVLAARAMGAAIHLPSLIEAPAVAAASGDFDGDGDVDGSDFLTWQRELAGQPSARSSLQRWMEEFGKASKASDDAPPTAVAEPSPRTPALATDAALVAISQLGTSPRQGQFPMKRFSRPHADNVARVAETTRRWEPFASPATQIHQFSERVQRAVDDAFAEIGIGGALCPALSAE